MKGVPCAREELVAKLVAVLLVCIALTGCSALLPLFVDEDPGGGTVCAPPTVSSLPSPRSSLPLDASGRPAITAANAHQVVLLSRVGPAPVVTIAFSPDGRLFAARPNGISVHDAATLGPLAFQPTPSPTRLLAFLPDSTVITGHDDGYVRAWDIQAATTLWEFAWTTGSKDEVMTDLAASQDGNWVAVTGLGIQDSDEQPGIKLWSVSDRQPCGHAGRAELDTYLGGIPRTKSHGQFRKRRPIL